MLRRFALSLLTLLLVALVVPAMADTVYIDDLGQGMPTVHVFDANGVDVTALRVVIQGDSGDDYLHFRLLINNFGSGDLAYTDLFEDFIGGTLSDRILVYFDPNAPQNGGLDVVFGSDPNIPPCFLDGVQCTFHYPYDAVENGDFQHVADAFNTNIGDGTYFFYARSDVDTTPEPGTMMLLSTGLLGVVLRKFRK